MLPVKCSHNNKDVKIKRLQRSKMESEDHYKPMTQRWFLCPWCTFFQIFFLWTHIWTKLVHAIDTICKLLLLPHNKLWTFAHVKSVDLHHFKWMYDLPLYICIITWNQILTDIWFPFLFYNHKKMQPWTSLYYLCTHAKGSSEYFCKSGIGNRIDILGILVHMTKLSSINLAPMYILMNGDENA